MISPRESEGATVKTRVHVYVSGYVQGVFFRARTMQKAISLGVNGWVRNLPDGRVEAVFEGEKAAVEEMVEFCRQGPRGASVESVAVTQMPFKGEFKDFSVRH